LLCTLQRGWFCPVPRGGAVFWVWSETFSKSQAASRKREEGGVCTLSQKHRVHTFSGFHVNTVFTRIRMDAPEEGWGWNIRDILTHLVVLHTETYHCASTVAALPHQQILTQLVLTYEEKVCLLGDIAYILYTHARMHAHTHTNTHTQSWHFHSAEVQPLTCITFETPDIH